MNPDSKPTWDGRRRFLILLPCAFFILATHELTRVEPMLGPLGVFGVNWPLLAFCILGFIPAVGLFIWFHVLLRRDTSYRSRIYLLTALGIVTLLVIHLSSSPPYDTDRDSGFLVNVAVILKGIVAPPGGKEYSLEEEDSIQEIPPDSGNVTIAFAESLTLFGLALWDIWRKPQRAEKPP